MSDHDPPYTEITRRDREAIVRQRIAAREREHYAHTLNERALLALSTTNGNAGELEQVRAMLHGLEVGLRVDRAELAKLLADAPAESVAP